jgi:exonuclease VII large subunit
MRWEELKKYTLISLAALVLAACANEREPAQKMMNDIQAAIHAASDDAAKYAPDQLNDVQTKYDDLQTALTAQDYKGVLARGPAVLTEAQGLAGAAAAKKTELTQQLNEQWSSLSSAVPQEVTAIQSRIEMLSQKKKHKLAQEIAKGIDLDAAKSALGDATSLWSKAQGAFGNGNMDEAVSAAKDAKAKLDTLAGTLKVDLPGGSAAPSAAPAS